MSKPSGQTIFAVAVLAVSLILAAGLFVFYSPNTQAAGPRLADIPFDGARSYEYLKQICQLGTRVSGTPGMEKQQQLLTEHFKKLGATVTRQEFPTRHPQTGTALTLTNLIVTWHPDRKERVLIGAHYDTRPYPDQDRKNPKGRFIGANDGASGVALLMELGKQMSKMKGAVGVDFVLFDAEELVYDEKRDPYFLGSDHFARQYVAEPPAHKYRCAVVVDMIADADLQLFQEKNSLAWDDTRPFIDEIWKTAKRLGVQEFIPIGKYEIRDDHLGLHEIGKIPALDIIDFDYGPDRSYWHTMEDNVSRCSPLSLAKVGWVVNEWLQNLK